MNSAYMCWRFRLNGRLDIDKPKRKHLLPTVCVGWLPSPLVPGIAEIDMRYPGIDSVRKLSQRHCSY